MKWGMSKGIQLALMLGLRSDDDIGERGREKVKWANKVVLDKDI